MTLLCGTRKQAERAAVISADIAAGPACVRLRVVLSATERAALGGNVLLDEALYAALNGWIEAHYRDRLAPEDLADPALMQESFAALDSRAGILGFGPIYDFQR